MPAPRFLAPALALLLLSAPLAAQPKTDPSADRVPVLKPLWKVTTIGLPEEAETRAGEMRRLTQWLKDLYGKAAEERRGLGGPEIPPAVPVVHKNAVLASNDKSVAAYALMEDRDPEFLLRPSGLYWDQFLFKCLLSTLYYGEDLRRIVLEHSSADKVLLFSHRSLPKAVCILNSQVYFLDEIGIVGQASAAHRGLAGEGKSGGSLWQQNLLMAADFHTGKITIKIGGSRNKPDPGRPLGGTVFLGLPIARPDGVCFLHEKDRALNLVSLSFNSKRKPGIADFGDVAAIESIVWDTPLVTAPESVVTDTRRRIHAIHLSEADGLVLCPTHLGRVVAVEAKTGKVRWTHEYAPVNAKRFPTFAPEWVVVPPAVADGQYVYAPADFPELLCLNVADGKKVWSVKKEDGLYPAVVGDKILVIGEKTLRALNLKDGTEAWKLELPGLPCGRGAVLGNDYLVPVSQPKTWKGQIAVVDLKAGKVREVLTPEKDEPVGNLVVHQDFLITQTLTELAVYPLRRRSE